MNSCDIIIRILFFKFFKLLLVNPNAANASYEPSVNEVQVPVLNRDLCNEWLDTPNVTEGMICAGYESGGRDACQVITNF